VSNRVRELRTERAWSQAELGERLAVSRQAINAIENGSTTRPYPLRSR
jgi:putative transcriptional regulator